MIASFTLRSPNGAVHQWNESEGFSGPLADILNEELARDARQVFTPAAELARLVSLNLLPGSKVDGFIDRPLDPPADPAEAVN